MKYRIKDHELQRKLDEISDGDFSARLHKERELIKDKKNRDCTFSGSGRARSSPPRCTPTCSKKCASTTRTSGTSTRR